MSTTMTLTPTSVAASVRCCAVCPYRSERVAWLLRRMDELARAGWEPCEAIASVLADPAVHGSGFGPGMKRGLDDVADIRRALADGHRDPLAISRFLCPWAVED